jgi:fimbrial chaperone protein
MSRTTTAAVLIAVALLSPAGSGAMSLEISPVLVDLTSAAPSATITVKNAGASPMRYQVKAFRWTEDRAGAPTLQPSEDFSIFPPLFQLAPGAARKVRVGAIVQPADQERSWRIVVEELPDAVSGSGPKILLRTRFAVPAFLAPKQPISKGELGLELDGKRLAFVVANRGNVRLKQSSTVVELFDATGRRIGEVTPGSWYVLAGAERAVEVKVPEGLCSAVRRVRVVAKPLGGGQLEASAEYPDGVCGR